MFGKYSVRGYANGDSSWFWSTWSNTLSGVHGIVDQVELARRGRCDRVYERTERIAVNGSGVSFVLAWDGDSFARVQP